MNTRKKKYIFVDGVMKLNPDYIAEQKDNHAPVPDTKTLTVVSSNEEIQQASKAQEEVTGQPMKLSEATVSSMEILQDEGFLEKFQTDQPIDGDKLLDDISNYFAKYEVPIGLINKLLALSEYNLNFIVDDSGSMGGPSDVKLCDATEHVQARYKNVKPGDTRTISRWQEAEDRIHIMIDMLSYIPTNPIKIQFLNRSQTLEFKRTGQTPEEFQKYAHAELKKVFDKGPMGSTPLYNVLDNSIKKQTGNTIHYIYTDGEPDGGPEAVQKLVLERKDPKSCPINFMSCTNDDDGADWMKVIEETADYVSEIDDYNSEKKEVMKDQGPTFPFTRGFWLLCQLCAPINPEDLDALDESTPFTKKTLDNLMGRQLSAKEYGLYFDNHPHNKKFAGLAKEFSREDTTASNIKKAYPGFFTNSGSQQAPDQQSKSLFSFSK